MTTARILPEVRRLVAEAMKLPSAEALAEDAPLAGDTGELESIALADLIVALETRFGFQFHDADLRPSCFATVRRLAETIARRLEDGP